MTSRLAGLQVRAFPLPVPDTVIYPVRFLHHSPQHRAMLQLTYHEAHVLVSACQPGDEPLHCYFIR